MQTLPALSEQYPTAEVWVPINPAPTNPRPRAAPSRAGRTAGEQSKAHRAGHKWELRVTPPFPPAPSQPRGLQHPDPSPTAGRAALPPGTGSGDEKPRDLCGQQLGGSAGVPVPSPAAPPQQPQPQPLTSRRLPLPCSPRARPPPSAGAASGAAPPPAVPPAPPPARPHRPQRPAPAVGEPRGSAAPRVGSLKGRQPQRLWPGDSRG